MFQMLKALEKQIQRERERERITILGDKPYKRDKNKIYKNI